MVISSRAIVAMGLCAAGLVFLRALPRPATGWRCSPHGHSLDGSSGGSGLARDRDNRHGRRLQKL